MLRHSPMNRRHALGLLTSMATCATNTLAAPASTPHLQQLGPDTYVFPGRNAYADRPNDGRVVNTGVIVGTTGVLVVDPGPHIRAGTMLATAIRNELGRPVVGVINTHAAPEYVLGNAAFADLPIYASAATRQLMSSRCSACLQRLTTLLGQRAMRGTTIVLPNHTLEAGDGLQIQGAMVDIRVFEQAHSVGDLALFVPGSRTVFGGALAYRNRIPDMREASVYGWLRAIGELESWPVRWFAGAGFGTPRQTLQATRHYLETLERLIAAQIRRGGELADLQPPGQQPWTRWTGFLHQHPLNVQRVWREIEELWWQGTLPT